MMVIYIYDILYILYTHCILHIYIYIYYDMLLWNGATHPAWSVNLRYDRTPVVKSEEHWARAFHGTWWYSVWLVLESGVFLESNDRDKGRDDQGPGLAGLPVAWSTDLSKKWISNLCWMRRPICCCINPPYFVPDKLINFSMCLALVRPRLLGAGCLLLTEPIDCQVRTA